MSSQQFRSGEVGRVFVAYNVFKSAINFDPTVKQVVPMKLWRSPEKDKAERRISI